LHSKTFYIWQIVLFKVWLAVNVFNLTELIKRLWQILRRLFGKYVSSAHISRASSRLSLCACAVTTSINWEDTDAISWKLCYVYVCSCAIILGMIFHLNCGFSLYGMFVINLLYLYIISDFLFLCEIILQYLHICLMLHWSVRVAIHPKMQRQHVSKLNWIELNDTIDIFRNKLSYLTSFSLKIIILLTLFLDMISYFSFYLLGALKIF
jgi:hypothetical protein